VPQTFFFWSLEEFLDLREHMFHHPGEISAAFELCYPCRYFPCYFLSSRPRSAQHVWPFERNAQGIQFDSALSAELDAAFSSNPQFGQNIAIPA